MDALIDPAYKTAQQLRLLLAGIKVKQAKGVPLTANEENLLAECFYRHYSKPEEKVTVDADGNVTVVRTADSEPVMQAMKDYGDVIDKHHRGAAGARMIGSVDAVTAGIWARECGAGIGTREFAAYAKKKLADSDFRRFRFGGGY